MKVSKDSVVSIEYELKSKDGEILDSSEENGILHYLQGSNFLFPALEEALEGFEIGMSLDKTFPPEKAYGLYNEKLVFQASRSDFTDPSMLQEGMEFQAEVEDELRICTIIEIKGDEVTIDANHPLCDEELQVKAKVVGIRDASAEELEHGHVHDGHEHH